MTDNTHNTPTLVVIGIDADGKPHGCWFGDSTAELAIKAAHLRDGAAPGHHVIGEVGGSLPGRHRIAHVKSAYPTGANEGVSAGFRPDRHNRWGVPAVGPTPGSDWRKYTKCNAASDN